MLTIYSSITALCWIIFAVYWMMNSSNQKARAHYGTLRETLPYRILWSGAFVLLLAPSIFGLSALVLPITNLFLGIVSDMIAIIGLIVCILARRELAGNWSMQLDLKKDHKLIMTGLYSFVRHPIYTGFLLLFVGTALALGRIGGFIGLIILIIGCLVRIYNEEKLMIVTFGDTYRTYKKKVKALIPYLI